MERLDKPGRVAQNLGFRFHQGVRREAALAFPDAHRATRRMKPHSDLRRAFDAVVQTRAIGEQVEMVG